MSSATVFPWDEYDPFEWTHQEVFDLLSDYFRNCSSQFEAAVKPALLDSKIPGWLLLTRGMEYGTLGVSDSGSRRALANFIKEMRQRSPKYQATLPFPWGHQEAGVENPPVNPNKPPVHLNKPPSQVLASSNASEEQQVIGPATRGREAATTHAPSSNTETDAGLWPLELMRRKKTLIIPNPFYTKSGGTVVKLDVAFVYDGVGEVCGVSCVRYLAMSGEASLRQERVIEFESGTWGEEVFMMDGSMPPDRPLAI